MSDGYIYEKDVSTTRTAEGYTRWPGSPSGLKAARDAGQIKYMVGAKGKIFYKEEWLDECWEAKAKQEVKQCEGNGNTKGTGSTTTSPVPIDTMSCGTQASKIAELEDRVAKRLVQTK